MKFLRLFAFTFLSVAVLSAAEPGVRSPPKEKKAPTDVRVHGEIEGGGGYVPWTKGLTLREALKAAGGLSRVARGLIIYTDGQDKPRRTLQARDWRSDPAVLDYPLEAGDIVWAWTQI